MSEPDSAEKQRARMLDGARAYAEYDKSDPFTLARCLCHIRQGLCGSIVEGPDKGKAGHYEATRVSERMWTGVSRL